RTTRALRAAELDAIVIHSGSLVKRSVFDDQYWPLRVVPHFQHWAPLAQVDCAIVLEAGAAKPKLAWLKSFDFWEAPPSIEDEDVYFLAALDVIEIAKVDAVKDLVPAGKRTAFVGEDASRAALWGIDRVNPPALVAALDALRTTKTPYEVHCLTKANE